MKDTHNYLRGAGVALVTPFDAEGNVDFLGLEKAIDHVIDGGIQYIVALGTTAETPSLDAMERHDVLRTIVEHTAGRIPVVAGFGSNNTQDLIHQIQTADLSGISAILSVCPYYSRPTQAGLIAHFSAVAEASPLPILLYNVPVRTASNLEAASTLRLAETHNNIIGIKEASGNFGQIMDIIRNKPEGFAVISGDDLITLPLIASGAIGVISVIANALPYQLSEMVNTALHGNMEKARAMHYNLLPLMEAIFREGNPAGVKLLMETLGLCQAGVRLPLFNGSNELRFHLEKLLEELK